MTTVGIAMVRDELDILPVTLAHMLEQCDTVIAADNGSRDGTRVLLDEWPDGRLTVIDDPDPAYFQSRKMSALAERARQMGAEWVVPFDADEVWLSRDGQRIADVLVALPDGVLIAEADLWDHVSTGRDVDDPNPVRRMRWRRSYPAPLPKVAVRALPGVTIAQGNHSATFEGIDLPGRVSNLLTVRHYSYRSEAQMIRKIRNGAAAYAATDLGEVEGAHWRQMGMMTDEQIAEAYRKWYWRAEPKRPLVIEGEAQPPLVYDPAPTRCLSRS